MAKFLTGVPAAMASVAGAVVNNANGAGTVTAMVTFVPLASVTTTFAVPPSVLGSAWITNDVDETVPTTVVVAVADTNAGLLLAAV